MKPIKLLPLFLLLCISTFTLHAQTLVNKVWEQATGHPTLAFDHIATARQGTEVFIVGNTYHFGEQENFLITKYNTSGTLLWQKEYNSISSDRDFGMDAYIKGTHLYVTGFSWDSASNDADLVTLKLTLDSGNIVWTATYAGTYGGYDAAAGVRVDNSGNVYVAGSEQTGVMDSKIIVVKYNSSGTQQWVTGYDSTGYFDGAVAIEMDPSGNRLQTIGFSGSAFSSWDFVTHSFSSAGSVTGYSRSANPNGGISKPVAFTQDYAGDLYVLGNIAISGTNNDIKLIKYDTLFNQVWVRTFGCADSLDDEAAAMAVDAQGRVIISGFTSRSNGATDMLTLKYDKNGNIVWSRTIASPDLTKNATGRDVKVEMSAASTIYVAGKVYNNSNYDYLTASYTKDGDLRWVKYFDDTTGSNDVGLDIVVDNSSNVIVSGICTKDTNTRYVSVKYEQWVKSDTAIYDTSGIPLYVKNHLIIRFNKQALKESAVNDKGLLYGDPVAFLTTSAYSTISSKIGADFTRSKLIKIFPEFGLMDTLITTRSGDTIAMPDFYTAYLLVSPTNINEQAMCDSLNKTFPLVRYAHLNYTGLAQGNPPNDPEYDNGSTGCNQGGLALPALFSGSINVEDVWNLETGQPFVKVGVLDEVIHGNHLDFGGTDSSFLTGKVQGWDFQNGIDVELFQKSNPTQASFQHGTAVAGIIGAIRNNGVGIAGIAGGDWDDDGNPGVSLYNGRIYTVTDTLWVECATVARSIFNMAIEGDSSLGVFYQYGLHIMNNSYAFTSGTANTGGSVIDFSKMMLLRDAVHAVNRIGVVFVAARGQGGSGGKVIAYPACYEDSWVINVSGSDISGNWEVNSSYPRYSGGEIDVIAPSVNGLVYSTYYNLLTHSSNHSFFSATSASCAHVSGVAALLLSYYNKNFPLDPLVPEDIEYLLEATAYPTAFPDPDYTGSGRVNAGAAINLIQQPQRRIFHFVNSNQTDTALQTKVTTIDTGLYIRLVEPLTYYTASINYSDTSALIQLDTGKYKMDAYKYSEWLPLSFSVSDSIIGYWPLHSQSTSYTAYVTDTNGNHTLKPYEKCYIDSITKDSILVSGYFYRVKHAIADTLIRWLPYDFSQLSNRPSMAYSILRNDGTISSVNNTIPAYDFQLLPNPSNDLAYLRINAGNSLSLDITLFDLHGKAISNIYKGKTADTLIPIDVHSLSSGVYFVAINNGERVHTLKLLKL